MNKTEIRFQDILWALKKHFAWICLSTMIFTIGAWLYTKYTITPMYRTNISFCIFSGIREGEVSGSDIVSDAKLAGTYKILLKSQPVLEAVSKQLDGKLSPKAIANMVTTQAAEDTQILYVYVMSSDPKLACEVAEAIAIAAPKPVVELARAGELTVVDMPIMPTTPYSPDVANNVTGGFILGLLLSCAVIIAIAMLDTTIWHEEDLERAFNIPVLGTVPSITNAPSNNYRSYEYRR
ncbi:MAG: hypothetical protein IKT58_07130 [Oscillospiraceae bacterium]|nr:hypothetical protein [Oscillospiraceae bacterium]